jgi:transposase-like protein
MTEKQTYYYCEECNARFTVKQGSRRRYCDACLIKRVKEGMNRQGKVRKGGK